MSDVIDLRSDTVTRPTAGMRRAMMEAPLGDDVLGDEPTVRALEERFAAHVGKEAACFVPTGTMANQTAIRAQTEAGDEIIGHDDSHIVNYETGGPAALSGCLVKLLHGPRGQFGASDVEGAIRPASDHAPRSRLIVVENTQNRGGGSVWPMPSLAGISALGRSRGLRLHLDGARLWNASVASGVSMAAYAALFDTVSCCFSKGLGAPAGSIVAGDGATLARVRRFRKMFGGAMRQSGVLAGAAIYAMEHHVARLAEDHANARAFARIVGSSKDAAIDPEQARGGVETNIVYVDLAPGVSGTAAAWSARLRERGVLMLATGPRRLRAVFHLDVDGAMGARAGELVAATARG